MDDNLLNAAEWNASETMLMFLMFATQRGERDSMTFDDLIQAAQDFATEYELPETRAAFHEPWLKGLLEV